MKKSLLFLFFIAPILITQANSNIRNYFRSDSAYVYAWNAGLNDWVLSSIQQYYYNVNGLLDSVISKDIGTDKYISKSEYFYNENGLLTISINYFWNGTWFPSSKYQTSFDENNRTSEVIVQTWKSNDWLNTRLDKYTKYNLNGSTSEFQIYDWKIDKWIYHVTDYWTYDEVGHLIKREAILPNLSTYYQIIYNYDLNGLMTEMYAQFASGELWNNSWLREYQYNNCSMQESIIQCKGVGSEWLLQTKTVPFRSFNSASFPDKKVPVCHDGNTMYISKNTLKAHLAHGDCIGECTVEQKSEKHGFDKKGMPENPPFIIYPNPASEKITIQFDKDEYKESKRVELTDFYGKLIMSFNIKDNSDLTIYRENLPSGKYYVRLIGKEVYSAVVIFE